VPGKNSLANVAKVRKLPSSESLLGASPKTIKVTRASMSGLAFHSDGSASGTKRPTAASAGPGRSHACGT
jgi:hypothetical protein